MFADDTSVFVQDRLLTNLVNEEIGNADLQNNDDWYHLMNWRKLSVNRSDVHRARQYCFGLLDLIRHSQNPGEDLSTQVVETTIKIDKTNYIIFETKPSKQELNQLHLSLRNNKFIKK